jgi:protein SCO1/2
MDEQKKISGQPAQSSPPRRRPWLLACAVLAFIALAAGIFTLSDHYTEKTASGFPKFQDYDFTLTDHTGRPASPNRFAGRPVALFFGFTYCPDVCPTTMMNLAAARDVLAERGVDSTALQVLFVTVDPDRDTPEQLGEYLGLFDADIIGLTGDPASVRAVLKQFGIYAQKVDQGDGDYIYDHSAAVFLYRADGRFKGTIVHNEPADFIVEKLKSIL